MPGKNCLDSGYRKNLGQGKSLGPGLGPGQARSLVSNIEGTHLNSSIKSVGEVPPTALLEDFPMIYFIKKNFSPSF